MKKTGFSPRGPDLVTEEIVAVLSGKKSFEFKPLFELVHVNLRARNAASGGEEMLRLRCYEKLQFLVQNGMVSRTITTGGKKYKGLKTLSSALISTNGRPHVPAAAVLAVAEAPMAVKARRGTVKAVKTKKTVSKKR